MFLVNSNPALDQEVSPDPCTKSFCLVPSIAVKLPETGNIGDMFLQLLNPSGTTTAGTNVGAAAAQLWICLGYDPDAPTKPMWSPVQMVIGGGQNPAERLFDFAFLPTF